MGFSSTSDKFKTSEVLCKERSKQLKEESVNIDSNLVIETVHPVKEEHFVQSVTSIEKAPIVFTTKQTETTYTVTRKQEPKLITEVRTIVKDLGTKSVKEHIATKTHTVSEGKFDVTKIRTDTLGKFEIGDDFEEATDTKKSISKDLDLKELSEITKDQVKPVIDDILQKGTIVAAIKSPVIEKDIKTITKEIVESERRSYDAKVPQKEERRHSCVSPAISLERITESEIEMEYEVVKINELISPSAKKETELKTEMKKSDSAMKQMADNIEIIIKQASEDVELSSEEHIIELKDSQELAEHVSVDSIIEEAVTTVEGYLETSSRDLKEVDRIDEIIQEDSKTFVKQRPGLIKSLSRDSGEIMIMPKKKQTRTFSVQSSPEEVEEQIYTDSESGKFLMHFSICFTIF